MNLCHQSARDLAQLIAQKTISPAEVVEAHLQAIEKLNPKLNAFCTVAADQALDAAKLATEQLTQGGNIGPLHGVPIAIKDVTSTAGIRTTYGSKLFENHIPTEDALIVTRLKEAGGIVIGKTNTSEFAAGANAVNDIFGQTLNPWNSALTPGGSTGGGAAALASRIAPLAEGTDMGGSLRIPAAFCGVVGLRPTVGVVPSHPNTAPWDVIRTAGPMAREALDCALMLDVIGGYTKHAPTAAPIDHFNFLQQASEYSIENKRIAYVPSVSGVPIDTEIANLCEAAALQLNDQGAHVDCIELDLSDGRDAFMALRGSFVMNHHLDKLDVVEQLGANLKNNIESGLKVTTQDLAKAEHKRGEIYQRLLTVFEKYDLLLTPTMAIPPFPITQNHPTEINGQPMENYIDWVGQTFLFTLCCTPAASVPIGLTETKLPVGLQIVGSRFEDGAVLGLARCLQEMNPIPLPPIS